MGIESSDFSLDFFIGVARAVEPVGLLDLLEGSSVAWIQVHCSVEQVLEILAEESRVSLLDFAVLVPELSILSVEEASKIDSSNTAVFSVREHSSGHKSEKDDTSGVDISSLGVLASSLDDLRGSVEFGSSAQNLIVIS